MKSRAQIFAAQAQAAARAGPVVRAASDAAAAAAIAAVGTSDGTAHSDIATLQARLLAAGIP